MIRHHDNPDRLAAAIEVYGALMVIRSWPNLAWLSERRMKPGDRVAAILFACARCKASVGAQCVGRMHAPRIDRYCAAWNACGDISLAEDVAYTGGRDLQKQPMVKACLAYYDAFPEHRDLTLGGPLHPDLARAVRRVARTMHRLEVPK